MIRAVFALTLAILTKCGGQECGVDHIIGETNPADFTATRDVSGPGGSVVLEDTRYTFDCCGVVSKWYYYALTSGTITFQAWRNTTSGDYMLVGESIYPSPASRGMGTFAVPTADRISVQNGDYIGWAYSASVAHFIPFQGGGSTGNARLATVGDLSVGDTYNWTSESPETGREWAVQATTQPSSQPSFDNLPNSTSISTSATISTPVFQILASDPDPFDVLTWSLPSSSSQFQVDSNTGAVTVSGSLTTGTYTLNVRVTDICGKQRQDTLTVTVTSAGAGQTAALTGELSSVDDDWTFPALLILIVDLLMALPLCATSFLIMHYINKETPSDTGHMGRSSSRVGTTSLPPVQTNIQHKRP